MKTLLEILLGVIIGITVLAYYYGINSVIKSENCIIHQWKDGVKTWKYQQYLERDDALIPPVALYECIKCGKVRISGQKSSDIFEAIDPNGAK